MKTKDEMQEIADSVILAHNRHESITRQRDKINRCLLLNEVSEKAVVGPCKINKRPETSEAVLEDKQAEQRHKYGWNEAESVVGGTGAFDKRPNSRKDNPDHLTCSFCGHLRT